jgi:hypothetical protein
MGLKVEYLMIFFFFSNLLCQENNEIKKDVSSFFSQNPHLITYLGQQQFKFNGETDFTATYTISSPGNYLLTTSIDSDVASSSSCIIYINSSDVNLNLYGNALTQNSSTSNIDGILINSGLTNITISNGIISGTTQNGIAINQSNNTIRLNNLIIEGSGKAGINFKGTIGNVITNSSIANCIVTECDGGTTIDAIGLTTNYTDFLTVKNSTFCSNNTTTSGFDAYGVLIENSNSCDFINCNASGNRGETISAGFHMSSCSVISFKNCTAKGNIATNSSSGKAYGFRAYNSHHLQFEHCVANSNSAPYHGIGFSFEIVSHNFVNDCEAHYNIATDNIASALSAGFANFQSTNYYNIYKNCKADGNKSTLANALSNYSSGFHISNSERCILEGCSANFNGQGPAQARGIFLTSTCSYSVIKNCTSVSNVSTTESRVVGIYDDNDPSTNVMIDCFAFGNKDTVSEINNNCSADYTFTNNKTEVSYDSLGSLTIPTHKNINVNN